MEAVDSLGFTRQILGVSITPWTIEKGVANVVGSLGTAADVGGLEFPKLHEHCDLLEIRLDMLAAENAVIGPELLMHLPDFPVLITARCQAEGGSIAWSAHERAEVLRPWLGRASLVDVEVASIDEMADIIAEMSAADVPWIASYHNFEKLPTSQALQQGVLRALDAGAAAFKVAARLSSPADLARLAEFQLEDHGIPVATMGMGSLAPVSRLLAAQCGSVLNYGAIGKTPTAPGQLDSGVLKQMIARLARFTP